VGKKHREWHFSTDLCGTMGGRRGSFSSQIGDLIELWGRKGTDGRKERKLKNFLMPAHAQRHRPRDFLRPGGDGPGGGDYEGGRKLMLKTQREERATDLQVVVTLVSHLTLKRRWRLVVDKTERIEKQKPPGLYGCLK